MIIADEEALIEEKLRDLKVNRILHLSSQFRNCVEEWVRLHPYLQFLKRERNTPNPSLKELRMIADLPELHHEVHQILHLGLTFNKFEEISSRNLAFNSLIEHFLSVTHDASVGVLSLGTYLKFNIVFQSSKHEGLKD